MSWKEKRKKEIEALTELIEEKYSIKKETLISKSRKKPLVMARRLFMNILFEIFEKDNMTHGDISDIIKRDRTSFIHHRKEHLNEHARYKAYRLEYDGFRKDFIAKIS
jgi:chromosomal replication initiation ATPase DnaA